MSCLTCVVLAVLVVAAVGTAPYRMLIPNGSAVPYPCKPGVTWQQVGHLTTNPTIGHPNNNPFGLDFAAEGHKWTQNLCQKDSDGDGRSNGVELGDPNCRWHVGQTPAKNATGHPGFDDSDCKNIP